MLYLVVIILAIIIGLLRGGELDRLSHISIKGVLLFAIALILRALVWIAGTYNVSFFVQFSSIFIIVSYCLLIFAALENIKLPGIKYLTLGVFLNFFVMLFNGVRMPVLMRENALLNSMNAQTLRQDQGIMHVLMGEETLFAYLGDVISLPEPFSESSMLSVGDILILIGIFILIQHGMLKSGRFSDDQNEILSEI